MLLPCAQAMWRFSDRAERRERKRRWGGERCACVRARRRGLQGCRCAYARARVDSCAAFGTGRGVRGVRAARSGAALCACA
eukprot:1077508-Pleurochrysis_carterae.AAC.2